MPDHVGWSATRLRTEALAAERSRQPAQAIALLEESLQRDPDDWKSVRLLSGLLARLGRRRDANEHLRRLAAHYERDQLHARAIAVWKVVLAGEPDFVGAHVKLGELYALDGFRADARKHYAEALARYRAAGRTREAALVEARIAELDEASNPRLETRVQRAPDSGPPEATGGAPEGVRTIDTRTGGEGVAPAVVVASEEIPSAVDGQVGRDDYETRYGLGIAYREMGLLDEAIAELQLASRGPTRLVECISLLAACFLDKGLPQLAIKWLERGLAEPGLEPHQALSLRYDLAGALEARGEKLLAQRLGSV